MSRRVDSVMRQCKRDGEARDPNVRLRPGDLIGID